MSQLIICKSIVKQDEWRNGENALLQREIRLTSYVTGIYQLVSDHLDGKDVIGFRKKDIPSIIEALQQILEDNK